MQKYDANSIKKLTGVEPIKQNPSMYIGSTGSFGLHHLILEIVSNSVDEALGGFGNTIETRIYKDGSVSIKDYGRGIPIGINKELNRPALEILFTEMNAGGKFVKESNYKFSAGLHGLGAKIVNALSIFTFVTVVKEGIKYQQKFAFGFKETELLNLGKTTEPNGTTVHFKPDPMVFKEVSEFDKNTVIRMLKNIAYLNSGITMKFTDDRDGTNATYSYKHGLLDMLRDSIGDTGKQLLPEPIRLLDTAQVTLKDGRVSEMQTEVVLTYIDSTSDIQAIRGYANIAPTPGGGTHITGFKMGLTRALNETARNMQIFKANTENLSGNETSEGLVAIVSVKHPSPEFEGQTKDKLNNGDVQSIISSFVYNTLKNLFDDNPKLATIIITRLLEQRKLKDSLRRYKEALTNKSNNAIKLAASGKLAHCQSTIAKECELYIVEGDSAAGTAKVARDRKYQAIMSLRGKVLNVETATSIAALENQEIKDLIIGLGCGVQDKFDINKLRYHKVIISADSD